jgi:hypothetical protein
MTKYQQSKMSGLAATSNAKAISATGPLPLHNKLYETFQSRILDGIWINGDLFFPITVLAFELNMELKI